MSRRQKILTPQTQLFDDKKFFDRAKKEHKKSIIDGSVLFLAPPLSRLATALSPSGTGKSIS